MSLRPPYPMPYLRPLDVTKDLPAVADLIEICFASTLDADGDSYLRHLRWAAGDLRYQNWMRGGVNPLTAPLSGFVWEEDARIVGNLNLIPLMRNGRLMYWIANVAVHPEYRRRGIAHQLTAQALNLLRERGVPTAWLQVRADNPAAYRVYASLGFVEHYRRTAWISKSDLPQSLSSGSGVALRGRTRADWSSLRAWLCQIYPEDVAWGLSLDINDLAPNWWRSLIRWVQNEDQEAWCAWQDGQLCAGLTWSPSHSFADSLWLAVSPQMDEAAVSAALLQARQKMAYRNRPLCINFPAGHAEMAFQRAGFAEHQTLIWMSVRTGK